MNVLEDFRRYDDVDVVLQRMVIEGLCHPVASKQILGLAYGSTKWKG
jgi:hypothetical protein